MTIRTLTITLALLISASVRAQTDEINATVDGVRQGLWRIEGKNGNIEEGTYTNGKKNGVWKTYQKSGTLKSSVTFKNGMPIGEAEFYFDNGKLMEKGFWNMDHWEGSYEQFHENGTKSCQFNYDNRGRREGRQVYYHDNGKVMYDGNWTAGKVTGTLSAYNKNGIKTFERQYGDDGKFQSMAEIQSSQSPAADTEASPNATFTGTGKYTLYNLNGTIDQKGIFNKGKLMDGERYVYDASGKLKHKEIYSNGELKSRQ